MYKSQMTEPRMLLLVLHQHLHNMHLLMSILQLHHNKLHKLVRHLNH